MPFPPFNHHPRNLTERFHNVVTLIQYALSKQGNAAHPVAGAILLLIWNRLFALKRRFAVLAEKVRTGTLPAPRPSRQRQAAPGPATPRPPDFFARQPGWLLRMLTDPWFVNGCREPLQQFLEDPELAALAAAAPQVGRLLRPLCRAIMHTPPAFLQLPPRPRRPRPKAAPKPKPPKFVDITRVSAVAWGHVVHPEYPGQQHPPNRVGYARARPRRKPG